MYFNFERSVFNHFNECHYEQKIILGGDQAACGGLSNIFDYNNMSGFISLPLSKNQQIPLKSAILEKYTISLK